PIARFQLPAARRSSRGGHRPLVRSSASPRTGTTSTAPDRDSPARPWRHPPRGTKGDAERRGDLRHGDVGKNLRRASHLRHTDVVKNTGRPVAPGAAATRARDTGNLAPPGSAVMHGVALHGNAVTERGTRGQVARLILEFGPSTAATLGGRLG